MKNQVEMTLVLKVASSRLSLRLWVSDSLPSDQDSSSLLSAGLGPSPEHPTPTVTTSSWEWTMDPSLNTQGNIQEGGFQVKETEGEVIDITSNILNRGAVSIEEAKGKSPSLLAISKPDTYHR